MPNKEFNSRKYPGQTTRHLVIGAIILMVVLGIAFVWLRMGQGPVYVALGTFAVIGVVVLLIWSLLSILGWLANRGE